MIFNKNNKCVNSLSFVFGFTVLVPLTEFFVFFCFFGVFCELMLVIILSLFKNCFLSHMRCVCAHRWALEVLLSAYHLCVCLKEFESA